MAIANAKAVAAKRCSAMVSGFGARLGGALAASARIVTGSPDFAAEPKSAGRLRVERWARTLGGCAALAGSWGLMLCLDDPQARSLIEAAGAGWSLLAMSSPFVLVLAGFAAVGCAQDAGKELDGRSVEWLASERREPGVAREYCAKAALLGRALTKGECDGLLKLARARRHGELMRRLDALAATDSGALARREHQAGFATRVAWALAGGAGRSSSLSPASRLEATACAVAVWVGVMWAGARMVVGLGGALGPSPAGAVVGIFGMFVAVAGFVGMIFSLSAGAAMNESTLSAFLDEAERDPEWAGRVVAARAKGRDVSAREACELLAALGARRCDAQAAELMGEAREDALAAKAAGPAIERARRGNEGSRLMLGSLSGGDAGGSSSTE